MKWGVVVLAGGTDEWLRNHGHDHMRKSLLTVGDKNCLQHTLVAVKSAGVNKCVTISGSDVQPSVIHGDYLPEGRSFTENLLKGADFLKGDVDGMLVLPSDSPFIEGHMVEQFLAESQERQAGHDRDAWYSVGLSCAKEFANAYPHAESSSINLREGRFMSGSFYALNDSGARGIAHQLEQIRGNRKNQLALLSRFGFFNVARYLSGRISLADAEKIGEKLFQANCALIPNLHPATCFDIDTYRDYEDIMRTYQERIVSRETSNEVNNC